MKIPYESALVTCSARGTSADETVVQGLYSWMAINFRFNSDASID